MATLASPALAAAAPLGLRHHRQQGCVVGLISWRWEFLSRHSIPGGTENALKKASRLLDDPQGLGVIDLGEIFGH